MGWRGARQQVWANVRKDDREGFSGEMAFELRPAAEKEPDLPTSACSKQMNSKSKSPEARVAGLSVRGTDSRQWE
jgi:hypothetical protein